MTGLTWLLLAVVVLGLLLSQLAGRLDRLHKRVDATRESLREHLLLRCSEVIELAGLDWLDPASEILLSDAAHKAQDDPTVIDVDAENDLTGTLAAAFPDQASVREIAEQQGGAELLDRLTSVCRRLIHAKTFHDDAVQQCQRMRQRPLVRLFRLAGRARYPQFLALAVDIPEGFEQSR